MLLTITIAEAFRVACLAAFFMPAVAAVVLVAADLFHDNHEEDDT